MSCSCDLGGGGNLRVFWVFWRRRGFLRRAPKKKVPPPHPIARLGTFSVPQRGGTERVPEVPAGTSGTSELSLLFDLPWPPSALSQNGSQGRGWWGKAAARAAYRAAAANAVADQMLLTGSSWPSSMLCAAEITFVPPRRGVFDRDNLLARLKGGLDGLFDALGCTDAILAGPILLTPLRPPQQGGRVLVRITAWR